MSILSVPIRKLEESEKVLALPNDHPPANLPVKNPTRSFWIDTPGANPLAKEGNEGPLTHDADVCIIGSGITGVSAAYHLSKAAEQKGLKIKAVILEARDFC